MRQEKDEEYSRYISFPLQDFKNLWEFKMACMKRNWDLVSKCGYSTFWNQEVMEFKNYLTKGEK